MCRIGFSHFMRNRSSTTGWCRSPIPSTNRPPVAACAVSAAAAVACGWRVQVGTTAVPTVISDVPAAAIASPEIASSRVVCASQYDVNPSLSLWVTSAATAARSEVTNLSEPLMPTRMSAERTPRQDGAMPRLFVAVWPSEEAMEHVRALPRDTWSDVRWIPEDNWHVTLAFLGDASIDAVTSRLRDTRLPASTAAVGSRLTVLGRKSLVVPVAGIDELAGVARCATLPADDQRFRGHITIGRSIGRRPIKGRPARSDTDDVCFEVREVALVASTLSPNGSRYETVATFPTIAPAQGPT